MSNTCFSRVQIGHYSNHSFNILILWNPNFWLCERKYAIHLLQMKVWEQIFRLFHKRTSKHQIQKNISGTYMQVYLLDPVKTIQPAPLTNWSQQGLGKSTSQDITTLDILHVEMVSHHWIKHRAFCHLVPKLPGKNREPESPRVRAQPLNHLSKNKENLEVWKASISSSPN